MSRASRDSDPLSWVEFPHPAPTLSCSRGRRSGAPLLASIAESPCDSQWMRGPKVTIEICIDVFLIPDSTCRCCPAIERRCWVATHAYQRAPVVLWIWRCVRDCIPFAERMHLILVPESGSPEAEALSARHRPECCV